MPDTSALDALRERVAALSEGSREVDYELYLTVAGERVTNEEALTPTQRLGHLAAFAPRYTASVDQALALVGRALPGWKSHFHLGGLWGEKQPGAWFAEPGFAALSRKKKPYRQSKANAPTLPLAILLALLSALAQQEQTHD